MPATTSQDDAQSIGTVVLPPGFEDAKPSSKRAQKRTKAQSQQPPVSTASPANSASSVVLPPGFEDAVIVDKFKPLTEVGVRKYVIPSEFGSTLHRELTSLWSNVSPISVASSLYDAFTAPATEEEMKALEVSKPETEGAKRIGLGIARLTALPVNSAIEWYKKEYQLNHDKQNTGVSTLDKVLAVLPEGLGTAGGIMIAGKVAEKVTPKAETIREIAKNIQQEGIKEGVKTGVRIAAQEVTGAGKERVATEVREHGHRVRAAKEENKQAVAKAEADHAQKVSEINTKHAEAVKAAQEKHANDVAARDKAVAEANADYQSRLDKARKESAAKTYAQKKAYDKKVADASKIDVMERGRQNFVEKAWTNAKGTYKAIKSNLDERWDALREKIGPDRTLNSQKIFQGVEKAREFMAGAPEDLKVFNDLVKQLAEEPGKAFVDTSEGESGAAEATKPMPWDQGRKFYSYLGDKMYGGTVSGSVWKALEYVRNNVLGGELERVAKEAGAGEEYTQLKQDHRNFERDWRDTGKLSVAQEKGGGSPVAQIVIASNAAVVDGILSGKYGSNVPEILSRWKKFGAENKWTVGAQRLGEQIDKLPKTKVPTTAPERKPFDASKVAGPKEIKPVGELETPEKPVEPAKKVPEPKTVPEVRPIDIRLRRLEEFTGRRFTFWETVMLVNPITDLILKSSPKFREWVASAPRAGDPDFVPFKDRPMQSKAEALRKARAAEKELAVYDGKGTAAVDDYAHNRITEQGLRQRLEALLPQASTEEITKLMDGIKQKVHPDAGRPGV